MKKLILTAILLAGTVCLEAGSDSFFGGFAGGATGSIIGGAIAPRRDRVIVKQVGGISEGEYNRVRSENNSLREESDRLKREKRDLQDKYEQEIRNLKKRHRDEMDEMEDRYRKRRKTSSSGWWFN